MSGVVKLSILALGLGLTAATEARADVLRMQFVGDMMFDGGPGHLVTNHRDPFAAVSKALKDADITVGNLECAITQEGHAVDKPFTFKGPDATLPLLKQYFTAVTLANNHSGDWGKAGFANELELLKKNDLAWFGGGATRAQAHEALLIERKGYRIAFLGYNDYPPRSFEASRTSAGVAWLVESDVIADIRRTRQQHAVDVMVLFLHWGKELDATPLPEQQALARRLIDAGADAIIGAHPHVTQTIEWYKDRPIVYSLGNFLFDYFPYDPPLWTGWMLRLTYGRTPRPELEVVNVQLDPAGLPHLVAAGT
jgi:poly-gamma-glutamate synthesis protein (capsule biosynthesis protein)